MPSRPLILSALPHDVHAAAVDWGLRRGGFDPVWITGFADRGLPSPVSVECDAAGFRWSGAFDPSTVGGIWFRRPQHPTREHLPHVGNNDFAFVANEWKRFELNINALAPSVPGAFWINPPELALRAENKLVQLQAAQRCGLRFPRTLVSSDPDTIRRFVTEHGRAVYKPFQIHSWQDGDGRIHSTYTRVVTPDMLEDDASLRLCPGIFQALIEKRCDYRVNLIGDRTIAVRLDSESERDFVDWRLASLGKDMRSSVVELPHAFERRLRALMRELGIVFGCVDLVEDGEGGLHFLEVNQAGQFLFLEDDVPGLPLLRAICAMLGQGRSDYDIDAIPEDVSSEAYMASAEHDAWWARVGGSLGADGVIAGVTRET